ncbi:MAG: molybdenum cofactor biosynthesis protein MoaE [Pseudomonadota bacterium]
MQPNISRISIQTEDFTHHTEYDALRHGHGKGGIEGDRTSKSAPGKNGAIVTFTGLVRDYTIDDNVSSIYIEHYEGMTEKAIEKICHEAHLRWSLGCIRVIHRIGELAAAEQIVFVGVTSAHRKDAFEAAQFLMDYLKQSVPLWKKEFTGKGADWVEAKQSDAESFQRWCK